MVFPAMKSLIQSGPSWSINWRAFLRDRQRSSMSTAETPRTMRMPVIHIGDSTHHHDQSMTPTSLSVINATSATSTIVEGTNRLRDRRRSIRMPGTLSAYGAGADGCYQPRAR
jgi:hypothetical protein